MKKKIAKNFFKKIAVVAVSMIFTALFFLACDEKEEATKWQENKWTLSMEKINSFAIAVDAGTPVLAISGKDESLFEALKKDHQNFEYFSNPTAENLLLFYAPQKSKWNLRYGKNTPAICQDSRMTTASLAGENYTLFSCYVAETSYLGMVYVDIKKSAHSLFTIRKQSSTVMAGAIYSLINGKADTVSYGGIEFPTGEDNIFLIQKTFFDLKKDPPPVPIDKIGSPTEVGNAESITEVEIISSDNSNLKNNEMLFTAWIKAGTLYLAKAYSSGFDESSIFAVTDGLTNNSGLLSLGIVDQKLYLFIANGKTASYIPIDLNQWKAFEKKELTLENKEEITKIRVVNDKENNFIGCIQAGNDLFSFTRSKENFQSTKVASNISDFDIAIENKTAWLCTQEGKTLKIKKSTLK